ncbi:MAG TPA: hypothetical protein VKE94_20280 [Gemmataceae bacterium]|nr:hypothetical protein [Gemmataceae bacterium]
MITLFALLVVAPAAKADTVTGNSYEEAGGQGGMPTIVADGTYAFPIGARNITIWFVASNDTRSYGSECAFGNGTWMTAIEPGVVRGTYHTEVNWSYIDAGGNFVIDGLELNDVDVP